MLSNKVYIGKIKYKNDYYNGEHLGIIPKDVFNKTQELLYSNRVNKICKKMYSTKSLLSGLLYDDLNNAMSPSHSSSNGKKYHYYISQSIKRFKLQQGSVSKVSAKVIDNIVVEILDKYLSNQIELQKILSDLPLEKQHLILGLTIPSCSNPLILKNIVSKIILSNNSIEILIIKEGVIAVFESLLNNTNLSIPNKRKNKVNLLSIKQEITIKNYSKRGNKLILSSTDKNARNSYLVNALAKCYYYHKLIKEGKTIKDIQLQEKYKDSKYVRNLLNLKYLPPQLTKQILEGTQEENLTLENLIKFANKIQ